MRTFKRQNAGTIWAGQRVLAWDSSQVTYADCDGDGNITTKDLLVIPLNFNKQHQATIDQKTTPPVGVQKVDFAITPRTVLIPIMAEKTRGYIGASGSARLINSEDYEILGTTQGNIFKGTESFLKSFPNESSIDFAVGSYNLNDKAEKRGILTYIALEPKKEKPDSPIIEITELSGLSDLGDFFPIIGSITTSVNENNNESAITANLIDETLVINFPVQSNQDYIVSVIDLMGRIIFSKHINPSIESSVINTGNLSAGTYFAIINNGTERKVISLISK
jgi:hypothetical protein